MRYLYQFSMWVLFGVEKIGALFNRKLAKRHDGIKSQRNRLTNVFSERKGKAVLWSHCSSLGEFEQARSILKSLKKSRQNIYIIQTFYSSSGYENCDNSLIDEKYYLPNDVVYSDSFLKAISPDIVIWCKYDFWFHYMELLKKTKIPLIVYSGFFGEDHWMLKPWSKYFFEILTSSKLILTQDHASVERLRNRACDHSIFAGDTRIDTVAQRYKSSQANERILKFVNNQPTLIIASSHEEDEEIIDELVNIEYFEKVLIFPHEIEGRHIKHLIHRLPDASIWSSQKNLKGRIAIIDAIGLLFDSYTIASLVYVGGGFSKGVHNTLEPAVFGKPILVGPNYEKFPEVVEFIDQGIGDSIDTRSEVYSKVEQLLANAECIHYSSRHFFDRHAGASGIVVDYIIQNLPK